VPMGGARKSFAFGRRSLKDAAESGLLVIVKRGCIRWCSGASGLALLSSRVLWDLAGEGLIGWVLTLWFAMGAGLTAGVRWMRSKKMVFLDRWLGGAGAVTCRLRGGLPVLQKGQAAVALCRGGSGIGNGSDQVSQGYLVDALALRGDEGRGTLR
jgi:hypothetical protein